MAHELFAFARDQARAIKRVIEAGVKQHLLFLCATLHFDEVELASPGVLGLVLNASKVPAWIFGLQFFFGGFITDPSGSLHQDLLAFFGGEGQVSPREASGSGLLAGGNFVIAK